MRGLKFSPGKPWQLPPSFCVGEPPTLSRRPQAESRTLLSFYEQILKVVYGQYTTGWQRGIGCLICRSLSAKEPYTYWLFCRKRPATEGLLCTSATLYPLDSVKNDFGLIFLRAWVCVLWVCVCGQGDGVGGVSLTCTSRASAPRSVWVAAGMRGGWVSVAHSCMPPAVFSEVTVQCCKQTNIHTQHTASDKAPTNKICRRASSEQHPRTRSCHESERLVKRD